MIDWAHIADRFFTHVFMDAGFLIYAMISYGWLFRWLKNKSKGEDGVATVDLHPLYFYFICCLSVILIAWAREPFDVAAGQPLIKVIFDYVSHLSIFAWCYAFYRMGPTVADQSVAMRKWWLQLRGKKE